MTDERRSPSHVEAALDRIRDNPFYVIGVRPSASRHEIEREGQKLLGMLELKLASAAVYTTPVGPGTRTTDKVRQALAILRDPERRLVHELWARLDPRPEPKEERDDDLGDLEPPDAPRADPRAPWTDALSALGWRAR